MTVALADLTLKQLDWDTDFFGARMGVITRGDRVDPSLDQARPASVEEDLRRVLIDARAEQYAHVIFRTASDDFASIWAAERAGLGLVDVGVDSALELRRAALRSGPEDKLIRAVRQDDEYAVAEVAAQAFTLSRFSADPFFTPEQVRNFHRTWALNLCHGLAQCVLVCEASGVLAGFVSCAAAAESGRIPLIATAAGYRGGGVGSALLRASLDWFTSADCREVRVKTQAHNFRALALYHRAGFTTCAVELTFSKTLGPVAHP